MLSVILYSFMSCLMLSSHLFSPPYSSLSLHLHILEYYCCWHPALPTWTCHLSRFCLRKFLVLSYYTPNSPFPIQQGELSFSRLECRVHDMLRINPLCRAYFSWHRHHKLFHRRDQELLVFRPQRYSLSSVESQVFTPTI